jgi:hypothetical protein
MYISIDRDKTRFMHKHADFTTVCELDYIGQVIKRTDVEPITEGTHFLMHWTEYELRLLYHKSVTGDNVKEPKCPHAGAVLRAVLLEMAQRLPETDADPDEASAQAAWIEERLNKGDDVSDYQYVRGSKTPGRKASLFAHTACAILPPEEAAKVAHARITAQATRASALAHAQASAAAQAAVSAPAQPKPARPSAGTPRSGVCKAIWEALDAERARINEIPDRAFIKAQAASNGWNASTASVQYAAWRKQLSTT